MHKRESVLEIETDQVLRNLKIQIDHQISTRRPGPLVIKKKTCHQE